MHYVANVRECQGVGVSANTLQKTAYAALIVLMFGVCVGWLGGL
jgi:hypothetical protein